MNNNVSIIIITFNRAKELKKTLTYILKISRYFEEIILVDNGSTDNTIELIKDKFSKVQLVRLHKNVGVAEARNIGAINAKNNLLLFLDDDGYFDIKSIPELIKQFMKNKNLAVIGCKIVEIPSDSIYDLNFEDFILKNNTVFPSYYFWGTAFMLRRDYFIKVGMFPDYFFYSNEENDLSYRLINHGFDILHCTFSIMLHYRSPVQRPSTRKTLYYYRNKLYEIWRNLPFLPAVRESIFVTIGGLIRTIFTRNFSSFCYAITSALFRLPTIFISERQPLSRKQYKRYLQLRGEKVRIIKRLIKLISEVKRGNREINF